VAISRPLTSLTFVQDGYGIRPILHKSQRRELQTSRRPDVDGDALHALLRRALGTADLTSERTADGVSTQVYRVIRGDDGAVLYARIAEEPDEDLTVDAELFERLSELGVMAPRPIHVEPFDVDIGRSVLVMTAVPGVPLSTCRDPSEAKPVAVEAGRQLAILNTIVVDGFGWVVREPRPDRGLHAEHDTYAAFVPFTLPDGVLTAPAHQHLQTLIEQERARDLPLAHLAHGDFDTTQIFHGGERFTGFIDFGEIRGTEPSFDLGHFLLHDEESVPFPLFDDLLSGYRDVTALPSSDEMYRSAVLLGARQLSRWLMRGGTTSHPIIATRVNRLQVLLA
jgi:aminoglycoside phosphotransferase (APT) family kinase protein